MLKIKNQIATAMVAIALSGCITTDKHKNQSPEISSYPQDIEQCVAQPDVIWCERACSVDSSYEWCDASE